MKLLSCFLFLSSVLFGQTATTGSATSNTNCGTGCTQTFVAPGAQGVIETAGLGGVTANLLAAKDTSNPTNYVLPGAGGCGSGFAMSTAAQGVTFLLEGVAGMPINAVADGTITAGHLVTGGTSTPGRVADTGQTARGSVTNTVCIVGVALASATVGQTVPIIFDGTGIYGSGTWTDNGTTQTTSIAGRFIGINTPTPLSVLHVTGTVGGNIFQLTNSSGNSAFLIDNAQLQAQFFNGSAAHPSITLLSEKLSGFYFSTGVVHVSNGGGESFQFVVGAVSDTVVATSTLPTCTATTGRAWRGSVSDATAPAIGAPLTGGGAIFANVHCSLTTGTYLIDGL